LNAQNKILAHSFGDKFPIELKDSNNINPDINYSIKAFKLDTIGIYDFAVPVLRDGGVLRLGLSDKHIKTAIADVTKKLIRIILIILVLVILLSNLQAKSITDPIKILVKNTQKIISGDYSIKTKINSKDEIGELAFAFDEMAANLLKSQTELKNRAEVLKNRNIDLELSHKAMLDLIESIRKEKDKINAIVHSIGDGVFVIDKDYNITLFNESAEDISGFASKEAIDKKYYDILKFVYENDRKTNDSFIKDVFDTGHPKKMSNHTVLIKKDGGVVPVADSASPLKDISGAVIGCVVVFRDATKERT
jgi:PAS domain S-box-containing protein